MDPGMNQLLKWSIENSVPSDPNAPPPAPSRTLDMETLKALMGGPSDAELMKESMAAIQNPDITLENKLIAFDNLEQLIESIDNANNLENLGLWTPLIEQLVNDEAELRTMAAWCVGTAVQNNIKAQERALIMGAIPVLVKMSINDLQEAPRRKAVYALSSAVRNYQPGLDDAQKAVSDEIGPATDEGESAEGPYEVKIDACDMEAVTKLMDRIRTVGRERAAVL